MSRLRLAAACLLLAAAAQAATAPDEPPSAAFRGHYGATFRDQAGRRVYWGHYGYLLRLPDGLTACEGPSDPDAGEETALLHPEGDCAKTQEQFLGDQPAFFAADGVHLRVRARRAGPGPALGLDAVRKGYVPRQKEFGMTVSSAPRLGLPALRAAYRSGKVEYFLEGSQVIYQFTATPGTAALLDVLRDLSEPETWETLRGFILVRRLETGETVYYDAQTRTSLTLPADFHRCPPQLDRGVHYAFAFRHDREPFEVRVHYRGTASLSGEYRRVKEQGECGPEQICAMVDPDQPSASYAETLLFNASVNGRGEAAAGAPRPLPFDSAADFFGADWGYFTAPAELPEGGVFAPGYRWMKLLLIHSNGLGEYASLFLADERHVLEALTRDPQIYEGLKFGGFYKAWAAEQKRKDSGSR